MKRNKRPGKRGIGLDLTIRGAMEKQKGNERFADLLFAAADRIYTLERRLRGKRQGHVQGHSGDGSPEGDKE